MIFVRPSMEWSMVKRVRYEQDEATADLRRARTKTYVTERKTQG